MAAHLEADGMFFSLRSSHILEVGLVSWLMASAWPPRGTEFETLLQGGMDTTTDQWAGGRRVFTGSALWDLEEP